jgi:hypothetical protein
MDTATGGNELNQANNATTEQERRKKNTGSMLPRVMLLLPVARRAGIL